MEVLSYNKYSSFTRRLIAQILDSIIINGGIGILGILTSIQFYDLDNPINKNTGWVTLVMLVYYVFLESSPWQATIGKKILGIKVVDENYQRISPVTALIRFLFSYVSYGILLLGYIWVIFDDKKQAWHDKVSKTYVIDSN